MMTLKEIERELKHITEHSPDCEDSEFLRTCMPPLIEIAKLAMKNCDTLDIPNFSYGPDLEDLERACRNLGWREYLET